MPGVQTKTDNPPDVTADTEPTGALSVTDHLEMALEVAREQQMSTSELMGIFFYYAHSIAESYRQEALQHHDDPS